ncbi:hypothetical protein TKK_0003565 [Trichogramma kaykai]
MEEEDKKKITGKGRCQCISSIKITFSKKTSAQDYANGGLSLIDYFRFGYENIPAYYGKSRITRNIHATAQNNFVFGWLSDGPDKLPICVITESRMVAIESWVFKVERILANDKNLLSIDSRATYQEVILIVEKLGESLKLHKGITSETLDPSNKAQRKALKQMTRDRTFFVNEISRLGPRMTSARRNAGQLIEKFKGVSSMSATPTKLHAYLSLYYIVDIIDMMREEAVELDRILQLIMIELPRLERNVPFWDRIRL